jgi:tetratricopeptide (TPR) repeat protein
MRDHASLPEPSQLLTTLLLCRLGMFRSAARLATPVVEGRVGASSWIHVCLAAIALIKSGATQRARSLLADLLSQTRDPAARASVHIMLLVLAAKNRPPQLDAVSEHADSATEAIRELGEPTRFDELASFSGYFRALSFVPFYRGDAAETDRLLDRAQACAAALVPSSEAETLAWLETSVPLYETRMKVATLAKDLDLAAQFGARLVEVDPHNPASRLRVGHVALQRGDYDLAVEHYEHAAALGVPFTGPALFYAAEAHEARGARELACARLAECLLADGTAVTAAERLAELTGRDIESAWYRSLVAARREDVRRHLRSEP